MGVDIWKYFLLLSLDYEGNQRVNIENKKIN